MQNPNNAPDLSKFANQMMNQSSSQRLDYDENDSQLTPVAIRNPNNNNKDARENPTSSAVDNTIMQHINGSHGESWKNLPYNETMTGTNKTQKLKAATGKKN